MAADVSAVGYSLQRTGHGAYLERGLRLGQGSLQSFLHVRECAGLPSHLFQLMAEFQFPKFSIIDTLSGVFGAFYLGFLCLLILLLDQAAVSSLRRSALCREVSDSL